MFFWSNMQFIFQGFKCFFVPLILIMNIPGARSACVTRVGLQGSSLWFEAPRQVFLHSEILFKQT